MLKLIERFCRRHRTFRAHHSPGDNRPGTVHFRRKWFWQRRWVQERVPRFVEEGEERRPSGRWAGC